MKREQFKVTVNGAEYVKTTFNAANKLVQTLARDAARAEGTVYRLAETETTKEGFYCTKGVRVWEGDNGNVMTFKIEKVTQ